MSCKARDLGVVREPRAKEGRIMRCCKASGAVLCYGGWWETRLQETKEEREGRGAGLQGGRD
eukprot:3688082-Rhodomonas_salina.1